MATLAALYNSLEDVYDVSQRVESSPEAIDALGKLLAAYGLGNAYDIRLVHKHFDIGEDEKVVAFDGEGVKLSVVCKGGELPLDQLREHGIQPTPDAVVTPTDFIVTEDGAVVPYEFGYMPTATPAPEIPAQLLREWNSVLHQHGLVGTLGLALQEGQVGGFETSDEGNRINMVYVGREPSDDSFVTTSWRVAEVGGTPKVMKCMFCKTTRDRHKCRK